MSSTQTNKQNQNHDHGQTLIALMVFLGVLASAFGMYAVAAGSRAVDRLPVRATVEEATSDTGLETITVVEPPNDPEPPAPVDPPVDPDPPSGQVPTAPQGPATGDPEPDPDPPSGQVPTAPQGPATGDPEPEPEPDPQPPAPRPTLPTGPAVGLEPGADGDSDSGPVEPPAVGNPGSLVQLGTDDPRTTDDEDPGAGGVMPKQKLPELINITDQDLKDYCKSIGGEVQYGTVFIRIEGFEEDLSTADCVKDGKVIVHCVEAFEGLMWNCVKGMPAPDDLRPADPQLGALEEPTGPAGPTTAGSVVGQFAVSAA